MSILINMEMPNNCADCPCATIFAGYKCKACGREFDKYPFENRMDWCPLIPVPPHGDLIDRRYAIATACSGRIRTLPTTEDGENWIRVEEVRESIKAAPTIIPAEPPKEE